MGMTETGRSTNEIPVFKVQSLTGHYQTKCFTSKNRNKGWKGEFFVGWRFLLHALEEERKGGKWRKVTHCMQ